MKMFKTLLSVVLVAAVLTGMVISANAYTVDGKTQTTGTAGVTYVYDFKDAEGNPADASKYRTSTNAALQVSTAADGLHFKSSGYGGCGAVTGFLGGWLLESNLYDPDIKLLSNGNSLKLEAGHYYEITVEWKSAVVGKCIGILRTQSTAADAQLGLQTGCIATIDGGFAYSSPAKEANVTNVSTFIIDADGVTGNDERGYVSNAGAVIGFGGNDAVEFIFEKISVTVIDKAAWNMFANNKNLTINFDNGLRDIYLPNGDGNAYGEYEIAEDPNNTGRGNTLKLTGTRKSGTTFTFALPAAPGLGAFKDKVTAFSNSAGFRVTLGETYHVAFDIYVEDSDEGIGTTFPCYLASAAGVGQSGNKSDMYGNRKWYSGTTASSAASNAGDGVWRHHEFVFTATVADATRDYLLIGLNHAYNADGEKDYSAIVYLDNITVTNVTDVPNAKDSFVSNVKRSIRSEGGSGENYVSAGLRFRGEIATATAEAAAEVGFVVAPEAYVKDYAGEDAWYDMTNGAPALDKALSVKATDKVYGVNGSNNQYQVIITKLTKEGEAKSLKNTYFNVVMYVKAADGTYTYFTVGTSSFNDVANVYMNNGIK